MTRHPASREAAAQDPIPDGDPVLTLFAETKNAPQDDRKILSISSLSLHHFRNYSSVRLELTEAPVVMAGHNGAGKTNVLEALSLLVPGRGLRRARLGEMDNRREQGSSWTVAAHVHGMQGDMQIGTGRAPDTESDKRLVKVDGRERPQAELARHMAMLWLTPQMEQLFNEGSSAARKFLDRLVYGFDSDHAGRISEYEYAMRERNRLLAQGEADSAWLDSLELAMAEAASAIAAARLHAVANINHAMAISDLNFPRAAISVNGWVEDHILAGVPSAAVEEMFKGELKAGRGRDAAAGRTLTGVHRSEMHVFHTEKNLPAETCSTGEQKALLLSIVLAEARALAAWKGVIPVLLLDEVIAHLDATRKLELFEEICQIKAQVWMTGTDAELFSNLKGKAQFFHVRDGKVF